MQSKESQHNKEVACLHHKKMKAILLNDGKPWTKSLDDWIKSEEEHSAEPKPEKAKPKGKAKGGELVADKKDSKDSIEEILRGMDKMAIVEKKTTLKVVKKS
jgi:hypothetical protein